MKNCISRLCTGPFTRPLLVETAISRHWHRHLTGPQQSYRLQKTSFRILVGIYCHNLPTHTPESWYHGVTDVAQWFEGGGAWTVKGGMHRLTATGAWAVRVVTCTWSPYLPSVFRVLGWHWVTDVSTLLHAAFTIGRIVIDRIAPIVRCTS